MIETTDSRTGAAPSADVRTAIDALVGNALKAVKNIFACEHTTHSMADLKTVGAISRDEINGIVEIADPVGVVCGVTPVTNPTSTEEPSLEATTALMHHDGVSVILATGGNGMVRAAYSAGKPALGVGAGNVPACIERSAKLRRAVHDIVLSKTFDNGMICASEQAVIVDDDVHDAVVAEFRRLRAHVATPAEKKTLEEFVFGVTARGEGCSGAKLNPEVVGRSPTWIAERAGFAVPGEDLLRAERDPLSRRHAGGPPRHRRHRPRHDPAGLRGPDHRCAAAPRRAGRPADHRRCGAGAERRDGGPGRRVDAGLSARHHRRAGRRVGDGRGEGDVAAL
ncbi:hypothetical protein GCM10010156_78000 [Planobispora rosea]|uniref:Aldehyde dehydrogenase domain-containing protein n=1 Tax=Planobispora rosea TaxID=35762 RepID=A0A8J3S9J0_PLARO|nr:hypothetical protein GCM10010156_78000 [Planobispora rosea]GIH89309.1 hypothetical protein Pro02_77170 [Planobispora rosea]